MKEGVLIHNNVEFVLRGPDGRVKDRWAVHNTMKAAGLAGIADQLLASPTLAKPGWIAIGTGTPASTLLGTEVDRHALTSKLRTGAVVTMVADFAATHGTGTITEAGVFDIVTANTVNMWASVTTSKVKGADDSLQITWTMTFA
jgi:hypothetical protein